MYQLRNKIRCDVVDREYEILVIYLHFVSNNIDAFFEGSDRMTDNTIMVA